ncbi:MAG: glycosyltransferase family A protein [Odoribacter sp.]
MNDKQNHPILSIVIPTKNRYEYLIGCLDSLSCFEGNNVEIVVQDNTENNCEIVDYLKTRGNDNIKYYHDSSENYSQTDNSNLAIEKCRGSFVCYIGDDDSVSENIIQYAYLMDRLEIDSIIFSSATYCWPDVFKDCIDTLNIPSWSSSAANVPPLDELKRSASHGARMTGFMPCVYHGLVRRDCLEKVRRISGSYFPGSSPDIAVAVALSLVIENHFEINVPIIVNGFGGKSAGGKGLRGQHKAQINEVDQLPVGVEDRWFKEVPKFWLGETIWCQSFLESLTSMNRKDLMNEINYYEMYARILYLYPDCSNYVLQSCKGIKRRIKLCLEMIKVGYFALLNKIKKLITKKDDLCFRGLDSLLAARFLLDDILGKSSIIKDSLNEIESRI